MDTIRQVGLLLCSCSLLSMLFSALLPKTGLSGAVKGSVGIFFAVSILLAISKVDWNLRLDLQTLTEQRTAQTMLAAKKQTLRLTEHAVADQIYADLKRDGVAVRKVAVGLHISKENCIEINSITVTTETGEDEMLSQQVLERYRGEAVQGDGE